MAKKKFILDIHKFADIDEATLPQGFKKKIIHCETYTDGILDEDLFGIERVREEMQENGVLFNEEQEKAFTDLEAELNKADCAYFRIINP